MIKNASSNLTSIISSNTVDTNRKIDAISKWIQDCPYTWGEDSPENSVYANIGTVYTDKKNGKVYKKLYNNGENNGWVELKASEDIGMIKSWCSQIIPNDYLNCDGSAISRIKYSSLFNLIGTTFGSGDGVSTFNLPDLRAASIRGVGTSTKFTTNKTISLAQVINDQDITHNHADNGHKHPMSESVVYGLVAGVQYQISGLSGGVAVDLRSYKTNYGYASLANQTTRNGDESTGKAIGLYYIIKAL